MKSIVYLLTVPLLAQQGANHFSLEKERALGENYASEIRRQSTSLAGSPAQTYVDRVARDLLTGLTDRPIEFRFEVIAGDEWSEPFALPGGFVFIPSRILLSARDEHEFAGTLAHAIGHTALRHGTRTPTHTSSVPLVFMAGWTSAHTDSRNQQLLVPVSFLEHHRTYELEADRFGLELTARAGYDSSAFLKYVERTHPADSKHSPRPARELRIARIEETLAALPPSARSPSPDFQQAQEYIRSITRQSQQPASR